MNAKESLMKALESYDTGRWEYVEIGLTGKGADLDDSGKLGFDVDKVEDGHAYITIHTSKSEAGNDVCLNLPDWAEEDEDLFDKCREAYMENAEFIVTDNGLKGEWDGDGWSFGETIEAKVKLVGGKNVDWEKSAKKIVSAVWKTAKPYIRGYRGMSKHLSIASGWKTSRGRRVAEGKICPHSAFAHILQAAEKSRGK